MSSTTEDNDAIELRASDWLARREQGFAPDEARAFETWLAQDPRHFSAFTDAEEALAFLQSPGLRGEQQEVIHAIRDWETRRRPRTSLYTAAGIAAALAVVGWFAWPAPEKNPRLSAAIALSPPQRTLADGSVVQLNAGADIAVDFTDKRRSVTLLHGEAHFTCAKDPLRPFVVRVGQVEVRALGTAFLLRLDSQDVDLIVTEGTVSWSPVIATSEKSPTAAPSTVVQAGDRITIPMTGAAAPLSAQRATAEEIVDALAWREMRFEFTDAPLAEAINLFNRNSKLQLVLENKDVGAIRVSGIYWTNSPDGFSSLLEASGLGVSAEQVSPDRIVLRLKK